MSKLILVDLAGNERDSARDGLSNEANLREEGKAVNVSLCALGACLRERANTSLREIKRQQLQHDRDAEARLQCADSCNIESPGSEHKGTSRKDNIQASNNTPTRFEAGVGIYRTSALTRLLKEHLSSAKIFFLACCSPAASSVATTGQTLQYAKLVKVIKTNAEDSAILLEQGMHQFPIRLIPHAKLVNFKQIPRSDQAIANGLIVYLHEVLRVSVVRVMVSHRWLERNHPDNQEKEKHMLICSLFERLQAKGWIRNYDAMNVVDWIDYGDLILYP